MNKIIILLICLFQGLSCIHSKMPNPLKPLQDSLTIKVDTCEGEIVEWKRSSHNGYMVYMQKYKDKMKRRVKKGQSTDIYMAQVNKYLDDKDVSISIAKSRELILDILGKEKMDSLRFLSKRKLPLHFMVHVNSLGRIDSVKLLIVGDYSCAMQISAKETCLITKKIINDIRFKSPMKFNIDSLYFSFAITEI